MNSVRLRQICGIVLWAALALAGCATEQPLLQVRIEEKIANAQSAADHEEIASLYEQQAGDDKAVAQQHRRIAQVYRGRTERNIPPGMANHCDDLATTYERAAKENLALAEDHRRLARAMSR